MYVLFKGGGGNRAEKAKHSQAGSFERNVRTAHRAADSGTFRLGAEMLVTVQRYYNHIAVSQESNRDTNHIAVSQDSNRDTNHIAVSG